MRTRGIALGALAIVLAAFLSLTGVFARDEERPIAPQAATPVQLRANPSIAPFQGMGTWIDIYDDPAWKHPRRTVLNMATQGVRTLYLETSNFHRHSPFVFKEEVIRFVDLAHEHGLSIVAWYLPGFRDLALDEQRSMAAIDLVTPDGNEFDGFALDIESSEVSRASRRTNRLLRLSDHLRARAGEAYPLGAIIPTPRRIDITDPDYWPGFPYPELAETYDAILPMTYYTFRVHGPSEARGYTSSVISLLRSDVGSDQVPIHVIGGIANMSGDAETAAFVHAIREGGVIGASFYTFPMIGFEEWEVLRGIPANPVGTPALPVLAGTRELGNIPGGDTSHPNEVVYRFGGRAGKCTLSFDAYMGQDVFVYVNWRLVGGAQPGPGWGDAQSLPVPAAWLRDDEANFIAFVAAGDEPDWITWGVRNVALELTAPSPSPSS